MAGGGEDTDLDAGSVDVLPVPELLSSVAVSRVEGPHGCAGQGMEACTAGSVVRVAVGDEDQLNVSGSGKLGQVSLVERPRIDNDAGVRCLKANDV
jgi:hypothetical protein